MKNLFKRNISIALMMIVPLLLLGCEAFDAIISIGYKFDPNYAQINISKLAKQDDGLIVAVNLLNTKSTNISVDYMTIKFFPTKMYLESIEKHKVEISKTLQPKATFSYELNSDVLKKNRRSELFLHVAVFKNNKCVNMKKIKIKV